MSKIVTFDQAKRLEKLGYDTTKLTITTVNGLFTHTERPIPLSEALDWIREEKGIACGVSPDYNTVKTGEFYAGKGFNGHCVKVVYRYIYEFYDDKHDRHWKKFDTHPLAENALLDAVLTYLENK